MHINGQAYASTGFYNKLECAFYLFIKEKFILITKYIGVLIMSL